MTIDNDLARPAEGFDRRGLIKRAAVVGVATAWATPTIQSLAAPAFAVGTAHGGCTACLTGGAKMDIVATDGAPILFNGQPIDSITFGLGQICCGKQAPGEAQIEVNAHNPGPKDDKSYHFTTDFVTCQKKDPNPAPGPNTAKCANVFIGTAYAMDSKGRKYQLDFQFEDHGEGKAEGVDMDYASIKITGDATLSGAGYLRKGNLQVHDGLGLPKPQRDCSGC